MHGSIGAAVMWLNEQVDANECLLKQRSTMTIVALAITVLLMPMAMLGADHQPRRGVGMHEDGGRRRESRGPLLVQSRASAGSADSAQAGQLPRAALAYLAAHHLVLDTILANKATLWALGVRRDKRREQRYLAALDVSDTVARPLAPPVPLADFEPYPDTQWFSYGDDATTGLWYAFDAASEGVAESRVFELRGGRLHLTFQDGRTCKPAELRREGRKLLLLSYTEFLEADCEAECSVRIQETVGVEPAWITLQEWRAGSWHPLTELAPVLARTLAEGYRKAARYVASGQATWCGGRNGAIESKLLAWETRADQMATPTR